MKNRALNIIIFLFVLSFQLKAQINLVPNYSFEQYDTCPNGLSYLTPSCDDWFTPISKMQIIPPPLYSMNDWGSSDYYNICSVNPTSQIPSNYVGYQYGYNGFAYSGFLLIYNTSIHKNFKEYIETTIEEKLVRNRKYCIEFYYSIAEFGQSQEYYPIDIGMLLTDTVVYRLTGVGTNQPQNIITTTQVSQQLPAIKDTMNWIRVSSSFISQGGEQYLTIGNFQNTDTLTNKSVYVYIDDVKLWKVEDTLQSDVNKYLKVYPIPTFMDKAITFEYVNGDLQGYDLLIYNSLGQRVFKYHFESSISKQRFPFMNLATGVYYYSLRHNDDTNFSGKLIILK